MSTDILTQLQTTYTQLLTQFYSTISYLSQRHPTIAPDPVPGQPYTNPPTEVSTGPNGERITRITAIEPGPEDTDPQRTPFPLRPDSPEVFEDAKRELAEDLILKAQQIQYLIERLPGLGKGEEEQKEDIRRLVDECEEMEKVRRVKRKEMRLLVERLDAVVGGMAKSVPTVKVNGNANSGPS